jgi:hypothetical protein
LDNHIETVISFGLDIAFEDAFITWKVLIKKEKQR